VAASDNLQMHENGVKRHQLAKAALVANENINGGNNEK
jgi:hypothetical protein